LNQEVIKLNNYKREYAKYLKDELARIGELASSNDVDNMIGNVSRIGSNIAKCEGAIKGLELLRNYNVV
jgi:hypothetical protein